MEFLPGNKTAVEEIGGGGGRPMQCHAKGTRDRVVWMDHKTEPILFSSEGTEEEERSFTAAGEDCCKSERLSGNESGVEEEEAACSSSNQGGIRS